MRHTLMVNHCHCGDAIDHSNEHQDFASLTNLAGFYKTRKPSVRVL